MSGDTQVQPKKLRRHGPITFSSRLVDRPGFDFGGSTSETTADLGLGLGQDSSDRLLDRGLPARRIKGKLSIVLSGTVTANAPPFSI